MVSVHHLSFESVETTTVATNRNRTDRARRFARAVAGWPTSKSISPGARGATRPTNQMPYCGGIWYDSTPSDILEFVKTFITIAVATALSFTLGHQAFPVP